MPDLKGPPDGKGLPETTGPPDGVIVGEATVEEATTDEVTDEVLLGPLKPGISRGMQVENSGLVKPY